MMHWKFGIEIVAATGLSGLVFRQKPISDKVCKQKLYTWRIQKIK